MSNKCEIVVFSDKAYNAIIRESFAKHPVETGGILLGHIRSNGVWFVMEMIPPGINGVFQTAYFEYDQDFVNYLGTSVANQYKEPLQVLGLWHRHPGSMDYFSSTDDGTNSEFASKNPYGVISGLVNIDPEFRLTMYHLDHNEGFRPKNIAYSTVDVVVGDDLIPEEYFALRYIDEERSNLHPTPTKTNTQVSQSRNIPKSPRNSSIDDNYTPHNVEVQSKSDITRTNNILFKILSSKCFLVTAIAITTLAVGFIIGRKTSEKTNEDRGESRYKKVMITQYNPEIEPLTLLASILKSRCENVHTFNGVFISEPSDSIYKISIDFYTNGDEITRAIYTNIEKKGKIAMIVKTIDKNKIDLYGKDGSKDFTINLDSLENNNQIIGIADVGNKHFRVKLESNYYSSSEKN